MVFFKIFTSTRMTALLFIVFAISMAIATFIENDYGTQAAKSVIYESWWFEFIMIFLVMNFIYNISRYQLLRKEKFPVLMFHLSFILIFLGGAISRYTGFEGIMKIREGSSSNEIITDKCFFQFQIFNPDNPFVYYDINYQLSPLSKNFKHTYYYNNKKIQFRVLDFIPRAKDSLEEDISGENILELVTTENKERKSYFLTENNYVNIGKNFVGYNISKKGFKGINLIKTQNGQLFIKCNKVGSYINMVSQNHGKIIADSLQKLTLKTLYSFEDTHFVLPKNPRKGMLTHYEGDKKKDVSNLDLIVMQITTDNVTEIIKFKGGKSNINSQIKKEIDGIIMGIRYGPKIIQIPFYLKLRDFQIERYPGSNSPSSYASEVTVINKKKSFDYRIFMNNTLNYQGFRFFQASFDRDEKGSIFSVNHDFYGTFVTYIGYLFLFLGMFLTLFWKGTRFWKLTQQLSEVNQTKKIIVTFLVLFSIFTFPQNAYNTSYPKQFEKKTAKLKNLYFSPDEIKSQYQFDQNHLNQFENILVQNFEGRIIPVSTLSLQLMRKLSRKDNFYGMSSNEWLLAISIDPTIWTQIPIIKIGNKASDELLKIINADKNRYVAFINLFLINSFGEPQFILQNEFEKAFAKPTIEQSFDEKEIIELNEKAIIFQNIISNQYLKFIPIKNHPNNLWTSWINSDFKINHIAKSLIGPYLKSVIEANSSKNWKKCNQELSKISDYQKKWGREVFPSATKIKAEIFYNKINLFPRLLIFYSIIGGLLVIFSFSEILIKRTKKLQFIKYAIKFPLFLLPIGFIIHLFGLGLRWYIAGHAPWSNGYEAVIFISWVGILAGFLLYKNSNTIILSAGCLVAVIMMGFAHGGSELNPQITPLVPVLKSYWLMIHVAIITSSYGFFGFSALIGIMVLFLFIFSQSYQLKNVIEELTIVNELSITIGLFLLTTGTFLGGVWANESWGRYWSWDPKETWALISIIVYAFVLHARLVPKLRGYFAFNFMSLIAFSSIIMTYFGVNYYLSGLHSYAAGDPIPIPNWIYYTLLFISLISIISYLSFHKLKYYNE